MQFVLKWLCKVGSLGWCDYLGRRLKRSFLFCILNILDNYLIIPAVDRYSKKSSQFPTNFCLLQFGFSQTKIHEWLLPSYIRMTKVFNGHFTSKLTFSFSKTSETSALPILCKLEVRNKVQISLINLNHIQSVSPIAQEIEL